MALDFQAFCPQQPLLSHKAADLNDIFPAWRTLIGGERKMKQEGEKIETHTSGLILWIQTT